jgi:hypothetical protein
MAKALPRVLKNGRTSMRRSILSSPSGTVLPGLQFGTAAWSVGGSPGVPSSCSWLPAKAPIPVLLPLVGWEPDG